jgi:hypothetical protein
VTALPTVEDLASIPVEQVPPVLVHLSALQAALAARLASRPAPGESQGSAASRLVTAKELASDLSFCLDRVYELARTGRIPCIRIGRAKRFDVQAVRKALVS